MTASTDLDRCSVSIGIPTFNRVRGLRRALASVQAQDYRDLEIVISDNASTDETEAVCREQSESDRRIRYIRLPSNRGATANFRHTLESARGELFMWLADDDWLDPSYVSRCAAILKSHPDHSLVAGADRYYENGQPTFDGTRLTLEQDSGSERLVSYFRQVIRNGTFYGLMRRELLARVPFRHVLGGDWLTVGAMAFAGKVKTVDDVFVNRSLGGASRDWSALAAMYSLSEVWAENPGLTIAVNVFRDLMTSPVYAELGPAGRLALGGRAFWTVLHRHYSRRQIPGLAGTLVTRLPREWLGRRRAGGLRAD
ncbi:MAG TPA: glycosyltransferase family 2 protein [Polyangia bacterium]|nr:glycosyltransferase family 2 protein [Polyangia bacterium]